MTTSTYSGLPVRLDLALGACMVATKAPDLLLQNVGAYAVRAA
jgi:hypothetical protein